MRYTCASIARSPVIRLREMSGIEFLDGLLGHAIVGDRVHRSWGLPWLGKGGVGRTRRETGARKASNLHRRRVIWEGCRPAAAPAPASAPGAPAPAPAPGNARPGLSRAGAPPSAPAPPPAGNAAVYNPVMRRLLLAALLASLLLPLLGAAPR